jgi:hypothetical protein
VWNRFKNEEGRTPTADGIVNDAEVVVKEEDEIVMPGRF